VSYVKGDIDPFSHEHKQQLKMSIKKTSELIKFEKEVRKVRATGT
jgi:hypothetical protein